MGLASSQARLLSLTSRMHQIEYKAAKLEAHKLQMANESDKVYDEYLLALEDTKVQRKFLTTDGSVSYKDVENYQVDFLDQNFAMVYDNFVYFADGKYDRQGDRLFTADSPTTVPVTNENKNDMIAKTGNNNLHVGDNVYVYTPYRFGEPVYASPALTVEPATAYGALCYDAFDADPVNPPTNIDDVITNLINTGHCVIATKKPEEPWSQEYAYDPDHLTSVPTNTNLREVQDETNLRKAEAKYEADMKKIDRKERYYDQQLSALEQERNAIKNEMDTLKTVSKDNVERTFKLFG